MVDNPTIKQFTKIDIEALIASKNPKLLKFFPRFILQRLKRIIHLNEINEFLALHYNDNPYDFIDAAIIFLGVLIEVKGTENLPKQDKRFFFVANHPLGGLDGLVFIKVVHEIYGDLWFPVNDLLMNLPSLNQIFLPINKHGSLNRNSFQAIDEAYRSDYPILYFPAGLCSRKIDGKIVDLEWKKSSISNALKHQRDIIPVYIEGKNSNFFYNLSNLRKGMRVKANIEMLYLVDEMFKQKNKKIIIHFGKPIPYTTFDSTKSTNEWMDFVRNKTYEMEPKTSKNT